MNEICARRNRVTRRAKCFFNLGHSQRHPIYANTIWALVALVVWIVVGNIYAVEPISTPNKPTEKKPKQEWNEIHQIQPLKCSGQRVKIYHCPLVRKLISHPAINTSSWYHSLQVLLTPLYWLLLITRHHLPHTSSVCVICTGSIRLLFRCWKDEEGS